MFYIVCIIISFLYYANNFDISSKPSPTYNGGTKQEPVIVTDSSGATVTDSEGNTVVEMSTAENSEASSVVNPVPESEAKPETYLNSCMFIGDSIMTGFSVYKVAPAENVFADVGLRIDKINESTVKNSRFEEPVKVMTAIEEIRPENVYILLGTNGIAWYSNDKTLECYGEFIDAVKTKLPDSHIYIISLTPVGTMAENKEEGKILNSEIDQFNARLLELANQKNVHYLDVNSELKDSTGKLPDDVTRDGIHFTLDVYKKFINYILTHTAK